ncbi:MAG: hypothetical protein E7613_00475 [Ruminococcaceae bacterium]|nr:hypothetical protein [Oscillospiraceae bacterium]
MKVGFGRLDITPPFGTPLDGYYEKRTLDSIKDNLYLNAIALNDGENTIVLISADIIGIMISDCKLIQKRISERLGIKEENIVLHAIHQHTSFRLMHQEDRYHMSDAYAEVLYCKFCDVAQLAYADMKDCEVSTAEKETAEQISFVRRYFLDDGSVETNPRPHLFGRIVKSCEEPDNTVRLIRFARKDAKDIALVCFSTHPDVIGGTGCSADWPGFTRKFVEADNDDVSCIFFTGVQGDSNHLNFFYARDNGGDFYKGKGRYGYSQYMGRTVANTVKEIWNSTTPHSDGKVAVAVTSIYNKTKSEGMERYDEAMEFFRRHAAGEFDGTESMSDFGNFGRIRSLRKQPLYRELPITAVAIGDIRIVGFAGEPFTAYGNAARELADGKFTLTLALVNGNQGYLPSAAAFEQGGYEASSSNFTPTLMDETMAATKELLEQLS